MIKQLFLGASIVLPFIGWQPLLAQAIPDIEGAIIQDNQIGDAIRDQQDRGVQIRDEDETIDGEAGIFVLQKNRIFFVGGSYGVSYSENPLRTVDDVGDSFAVNFAATAGVQTRIDDAFDFGLNVAVSGSEYSESFAPSSRNVNGALSVGTPIGGTPLYLNGTVFGGFNFDEDFENGSAFYGGSISLGAAFPIGKRTLIRPGISATRQWSEVEDNNSTSAAVTIGVVHAIDPQWTLAANARVNRTWFDDFFEDVTFLPRKDWQYGGNVSMSYRHNENITASVSAGYEKRDSTFFLSEFESFEASLIFALRVGF